MLLYLLASQDPNNPLVQYGLLGFLFMGLVYVWLGGRAVSGKEYDRVVAEKMELQRTMPDTLAALVASTAATQEATKVMRDVLVALQVTHRPSSP